MAKLTEEYQRRARREGTKTCPLCGAILDVHDSERGVVEFMDGWFWVCGKCKEKLGRTFDCTQHDDYGEGEVIRCYKRSRRYSLKWLKEEYQIEISQQN